MFKKMKCLRLLAHYSTRTQLDPSLVSSFESNVYKPRNHPGKVKTKVASIPEDIQNAIKIILEDNSARALYTESVKLSNYLNSRLLPPEQSDITKKASEIYQSVSKRVYASAKNEKTEKEMEQCQKKIESQVFNILKNKVYRWGNIMYDRNTCLQYLMSRAAPEYAVLMRVFDEIKYRCPDFRPRSFFDFGSGIGTGTWAVNSHWQKDIYEYYCVDASSEMNDLARLILCKGRDNVEMPLKNYYQRQFLPASAELKYNIVLSAYSLLEMPNLKSRMETVQKLWNKTEDFLVIVEQGTKAGFTVVNEARDFVLDLKNQKGYAFSPCPHDRPCPRYAEQKTPCNFLMKYKTLKFPSKVEVFGELYTYVILRKGQRSDEDPQWPRVVRAPVVRSGHVICSLCSSDGQLKESIFSKSKHDQTTYRCARSSFWGDLLPIK